MDIRREHVLMIEGAETDALAARELLASAGYRVRLPERAAEAAPPCQGGTFCRQILERLQDGIWISDAGDTIRYANSGMERIAGVGREAIVGRNLFSDFGEDTTGEFNRQYLQARESLEPTWYEVEVRTPGGRQTRQNGWLVPLVEAERFAGMIVTIRDVTERVRAEEGLKKALESQEILMKEIQHRVKNSLNVVSSILRIEKDGLADEKAQAVFADAIARIRSISAVYEHLARSNDHANVAFDLYVRDIVDSVVAGEIVDSGIVLRTELSGALVDTKRAVPLGLILNELLTNALKYAYPPGKPGEIRVRLSCQDGQLSLSVEDDGAGFAPSFDLAASPGLGMTLVRMLSEQIGGRLEVSGEKGTRIGVRLAL